MNDLVSTDPAEALERATDPGEFVVMALERGKSWLAEALAHGDLDALVNAKGYAETLRVATMQKQLGKDAELSAAELVRRAERCIGLGIRQGQAAGEIATRSTAAIERGRRARVSETFVPLPRATDYASHTELQGNGRTSIGIFAMTDEVTDDQFEAAIAEAKAERNMDRANVVRKVRAAPGVAGTVDRATELAAAGNTTTQIATAFGYSRDRMRDFLRRHNVEVPADAVVGRQRNFDSTRIVASTIDAITGIGMLFDRIDYSTLNPEDVNGWLPILNDSISSLTKLRNRLKEVSQP